jgi:hypothetical protein
MPVKILTGFKSYLAENFQAAFSDERLAPEIAEHSAHCFDYLRQSIMCSGNVNLEEKSETGPGWGSKHECTDYDALLKWANDRSPTYIFRGNMPDQSTL